MNRRFFLTLSALISTFLIYGNHCFAADTIVSSSYIDTNADGRIDHLKWVFDENITQCTFENRDWEVDVMGDMKIDIVGVNTGDPEASGEGACDGTDPVIYLAVTADEKETGSSRAPLVSYRNKGANNSLQDYGGIISEKVRQEQSDGAKPVITSVVLDFNDIISQLSVAFSEQINVLEGDAGFYINNVVGENDTKLSAPEIGEDGSSLIFKLSEDQRVHLLALSGVSGGDGNPLMLEVDPEVVKDRSESENMNKAIHYNRISEIPDETGPELKEWYIDLNKNQFILTFSELLDLSTFAPTNIGLQKSENSASGKVTLTGGALINKKNGVLALDLVSTDVNSIISKDDLATSSGDAFLVISYGLVDDLAGNNNVAISSSEALQASSYIGRGTVGELIRPHLLLSDNQISAVTEATVVFEIENDLPSDGEIEIIFPEEFSLKNILWAKALSGIDGSLDISVSGQEVTVLRQGDGQLVPAGSHLSFELGDIINPRFDGLTSDFIFRTRTGEGVLIDQNEEVSGQTLILKKTVTTVQAASENTEKVEELESTEEVESPVSIPAIPNFGDIVGHWAETYIQQIAERGIVQGKSASHYAPDDNISRAELLKIAVNAFQYEIPEVTEPPLPDVPVDSWYAPYVKSAFNQNIINGFEEGLMPNEIATRGMTVTILAKAAGFEELAQDTFENSTNFPDVSGEEYYAPYVAYLYDMGVISGYEDGTFGPGNPITRAEIAKIVVNLLGLPTSQ